MWTFFLVFLALITYHVLQRKAEKRRRAQQWKLNSLAKLPTEVRIQIFKHYFTAFRPESYYREPHYKETYSLNLLIALGGDPDSKCYDEALEQYHLSSHLLYTERGKDVFDKAPTWAIRSIKDATFGPSIFERPIIPDCKDSKASDYIRLLSEHYDTLADQYFARCSRLSPAEDLKSLTIYLHQSTGVENDLMCSIISLAYRTFRSLTAIRFCFPSKRASLVQVMKSMHIVCSSFRGLNGATITRLVEYYGCRHEIVRYEWYMQGGRLGQVEFVIYYW